MCLNKACKSAFVVSLLLILAACGGGGGDNDPGQTGVASSVTVLNGQIADGYLVGARVFLDRNGNHLPDVGEPSAESGVHGHYSLKVQAGEGARYPVVAEVLAGQTLDEDHPQQTVAESYRLEAPAGRWAFISPLTTLVKNELDKNPSLLVAEAETRIRGQLGLSPEISLFEDYIQSQDSAGMQSAQRAAKIIARLMGRLQTEIDLNVGVVDALSQRVAIALMISDQIMNNCSAIALGLGTAVDDVGVEEVTQAILASIDTGYLNPQLLDRYLERMQMANPVWDMAGPKILNQRPLTDGSASIDVVVSMTFDEKLDPATVVDGTIQLIGPSGAVSGSLVYDQTLKQLDFTPHVYLQAFTSYEIAVAGLSDGYGNFYKSQEDWRFTTIFDQLPPNLPEF